MTPVEAAWVAGVIEGEGCIGWEGTHPRIRVKMSDQDTVERLAKWSGMGRVIAEVRPEGRKNLWAWTVNTPAEFLSLANQIEPYLLSRRLAKLNEVRAMTAARRAGAPARLSLRSQRSWVTRRAKMEKAG